MINIDESIEDDDPSSSHLDVTVSPVDPPLSSLNHLAPPTESILMEGWIIKEGAMRKNWKKRYMVLTAQRLQYFRLRYVDRSFLNTKKKLKGTLLTKNILAISKITLYKNNPECLCINTPSRSLYFLSIDPTELAQWLAKIMTLFIFRLNPTLPLTLSSSPSNLSSSSSSSSSNLTSSSSSNISPPSATPGWVTYTRIFSIVSTIDDPHPFHSSPTSSSSSPSSSSSSTASSCSTADSHPLLPSHPLHLRAFAHYEDVVQPEVLEDFSFPASPRPTVPQHVEAIAYQELSLQIKRQASSQHLSSPDLYLSLLRLAALHRLIADHPKAVSLYEEALAASRALHPDQQPRLAFECLLALGSCHYAAGSFRQASAALESAAAAAAHPSVAQDPAQDAARALLSRAQGMCFHALGEFVSAVGCLEAAWACPSTAASPAHERAVALSGLGLAYQRLGDAERAQMLLQEAADVARRGGGEWRGTALGICLQRLGAYHAHAREWRRARELTEEALRYLDSEPERAPLSVCADGLNNLGVVAKQGEQYAQVLPLYRRSLEVRAGIRGISGCHPAIAGTMYNTSLIEFIFGHSAQAFTDISEAQGMYISCFTPDHYSSIRATILASHFVNN